MTKIYKSNCKACGHLHLDGVCNTTIQKIGQVSLRPKNYKLWGLSGAMTQDYDIHTNTEQLSFKAFDTFKEECFDYRQDVDCGCMFYVPSDNLEFLEWKYDNAEK